jgi:hypothetical protein
MINPTAAAIVFQPEFVLLITLVLAVLLWVTASVREFFFTGAFAFAGAYWLLNLLVHFHIL